MECMEAGILDIILSFGVSFGIALAFGLDFPRAFLIGAVFYATSSPISAKLLERHSEKHEDIKVFVLALLIFEDMFAPLLLTVVPFIILKEPVAMCRISEKCSQDFLYFWRTLVYRFEFRIQATIVFEALIATR